MAGNHSDETVATTEEHDGFCTLEVRSKRGTGTRNEDRVKATLSRSTLEEVEAERDRVVGLVEKTLEDARAIQPDDDDE